MVEDLFMWLIQPCLDFIRHDCKMLITTSQIHLVRTMMRLFQDSLDEIIACGNEAASAEDDGAPFIPSMSSSQVRLPDFTWLGLSRTCTCSI